MSAPKPKPETFTPLGALVRPIVERLVVEPEVEDATAALVEQCFPSLALDLKAGRYRAAAEAIQKEKTNARLS